MTYLTDARRFRAIDCGCSSENETTVHTKRKIPHGPSPKPQSMSKDVDPAPGIMAGPNSEAVAVTTTRPAKSAITLTMPGLQEPYTTKQLIKIVRRARGRRLRTGRSVRKRENPWRQNSSTIRRQGSSHEKFSQKLLRSPSARTLEAGGVIITSIERKSHNVRFIRFATNQRRHSCHRANSHNPHGNGSCENQQSGWQCSIHLERHTAHEFKRHAPRCYP